MNSSPWEGVAKLALSTIGMADNKAWICIAITLCVVAAVVRMMMTHADKMSRLAWALGILSIVVMGGGVALGVAVTYARGAIVNEKRGKGIVDFRRGHFDSDEGFEERAAKATSEDFNREYRQLSRDYFKIADAKFSCLTFCQASSIAGWFLAGTSALLSLFSIRQALRKLPIEDGHCRDGVLPVPEITGGQRGLKSSSSCEPCHAISSDGESRFGEHARSTSPIAV